ncbi:hypothetical protein K7X08_022516 [Anisodus acutangulus]|uniref:Large ribosomal subunit protein uL30-like ferredoxin-like fold domain-containing protein n=1 Tax=Anisodus acutangulus TaxID=402998 RepID=A0A9Q1RL03_9SOLA|nr:hypothetical protein K7X08_022516 [Anisodus acutangulus]
MAEKVPQSLNYIPEVILKKRKNNEEWAIRRKLELEQKVRKLKSDSSVIKKPEQFIREYRDKSSIDCLRSSYLLCSFRRRPCPNETKGGKKKQGSASEGKSYMHPRTRKLLYSSRLRKISSGVFVKANERIMEILQKVEPYVTYGVKGLLYKKGSGKIDNQRVPLTSNDIVEQTLGQHGIVCLEDVVGPDFKEVTSFLCPFSLAKPEKALQGKKRRYNDGGDSGNREDHINELISKMN